MVFFTSLKERVRLAAVTWISLTCVPLVCLVAGGCDPPPRPPLSTDDLLDSDIASGNATVETAPEIQSPLPTDKELRLAEKLPLEWWSAYIQSVGQDGIQIGYSQVEARRSETDSQVEYRMKERLLIPANDTIIEQILVHDFVEETNGRLIRFDANLKQGESTSTASGRVENSKLNITIDQGGEQTEQTQPWDDETGGFLALYQQLYEKPLEVGETRTFEMLAPMFFQRGTIELEATGVASVATLDGEYVDGIELESKASIGNQPATTIYVFVDENGEVINQVLPTQGIQMARTDAANATMVQSPVKGLVSKLDIPTDKQIDSGRPLRGVLIRVTPKNGSNVLDWIETCPNQILAKPDANGSVAVAAVSEQSKNLPLALQASNYPGPTENDTRTDSTELMQVEALRPLFAEVLEAESVSDDEKLQQIVSIVRSTLTESLDPDIFASAATAAAMHAGDRTEFALLTTAGCRAAGIPARVAAGYVFEASNTPTLKFGLWTVAYSQDRWVVIDAAQANPFATSNRLTFIIDDLSEQTDFALYKYVENASEHLNIQVEDIFYVNPKSE